ncbi:MAG: ROK family protein [Nocardioides sp.]|uniref:ROK family protein n=1 Tax=Nocardioides sp. TaxID=35761 RepID=UPI0039E3DDAB
MTRANDRRLRPTLTVMRHATGASAAQVFEHVRSHRIASRDDIAVRTGLSIATVGRTVTAMVEAGLLRESEAAVRPGATGRPGVRVEVDTERHAVIGFHLGAERATVALSDLTGAVLAHGTVGHPVARRPDLEQLSRAAATLLGRLSSREPVSVGVVGDWVSLGLDSFDVAAEVREVTGLPVRAADHIAATAAADFLHRANGAVGTALYVYGADSFGITTTVDRTERVELHRSLSLEHFPHPFPSDSGPLCSCGRSGCLTALAGDEALARHLFHRRAIEAPRVASVYESAGDPVVLAELRHRARALGHVAALARDIMMTPDAITDRVVLIGRAFTACAEVRDDIIAAYREFSATVAVPVEFGWADASDAIVACTAGLAPVIEDPMAVAPGAPSRRGEHRLSASRTNAGPAAVVRPLAARRASA